MKPWLGVLRNVLLALVVIAVGELLPPLQALEQWMAPRRAVLTWSTAGLAALGWLLLMGATLYRTATGGGSLKRDEIAAHVASVKSHLAGPMAASRAYRYMLPKRAWGGGFSDEVSVAQFKAAWRQALWRSDSRWRGLFIMAAGAALMALGLFGIGIVLCSPGLKLLFGGALWYAAVRTTQAFLRA